MVYKKIYVKKFTRYGHSFFVFGVSAGALRSNLDVPARMAKFLLLYFLMALGLKVGFAQAESDFWS